ncbi:Hypothetical predicted protein [Lecanosticta acicola]|uniref:Uncharacterized protein n=1 Tax=Lecanosticta acicola TaxID=111012 RepID=A0AAI9EA98_9PEZI|nr:Hypothetical predicted protein [Lecanosticta acicola]
MDGPRAIHATASERSAQHYAPPNIQAALGGLHQDGLLLLKNIIDTSHIDRLRAAMSAETHSLLTASPRANLYNQGVNSNILQCPPLDREDCLFADVYFNPFVCQLANAYLGSRPIWNFTTGNNALARTEGLRQPVHKDITFADHPTAPFYLIANMPLSNFSPANGATEFWLGSHAHTTSSDQIPCTEETKYRASQIAGYDPTCEVRPHIVEARRKVRPPVQVACERGDVLIRDLRTWHAGMPNTSDEDRIMVAVGYQAPWYANHTQRLYVPVRHANFFLSAAGRREVEVRATLVEEEEEEKGVLWRNYGFAFEPSGKGEVVLSSCVKARL